MSALTKAASRFDAAFAALPPEARARAMLAIHRAAPALEQYQRDLAPLAESPELIDALWDLVIAAGFRVGMKGRGAFTPEIVESMRAAAPTTSDFIERTGRLLAGVLPGFSPPALPAAAPAALPPAPPDAEIVGK